ncbi:MAG: hypothetical protein AAGI28_13230 [Pseudomonadota bacterium]
MNADATNEAQFLFAQRFPKAFFVALGLNFLWINASEIWRYLYVIKPLLLKTFPDDATIAPFDLATFAIWSVWDLILVFAATGFYWIYLAFAGPSIRQSVVAASYFTITLFGLIWIGIFNMGLAPAHFIWVALPLAWIEQVIAALIVWKLFPK